MPSSYNDDVEIPHFVSARRAYLGAQRRGIIDDHPDARTTVELANQALCAPFFLAQEIPLPASTKEALGFPKSSPPADVEEFRMLQLLRTSTLVSASKQVGSQWRSCIPHQIPPASAKIELSTLMTLMI